MFIELFEEKLSIFVPFVAGPVETIFIIVEQYFLLLQLNKITFLSLYVIREEVTCFSHLVEWRVLLLRKVLMLDRNFLLKPNTVNRGRN